MATNKAIDILRWLGILGSAIWADEIVKKKKDRLSITARYVVPLGI